jgi:predicted MPP superfamily phosphohydrolase
MYILHLSDLHFGNLNDANLWQNQLAADLQRLKCSPINALILSGDIANKSTPEEYAAAKKFLDNLREEFPIKRQNIVIVPGNHDLNWGLSEDAYTPVKRKNYPGQLDNRIIDKGGDYIEVRDEKKYQDRFNQFSKFYEDVTGKAYPSRVDQQGILYRLTEQKILFLGLNSAWELDHHYKERASINIEALNNALTDIRLNKEYNNWLKIAVWHHPLNSNSEDRIKDHGFMEQLATSGFRLALHGHIHQADNSLYRYDRSVGGRKIEVISAGTFGANTKELVPAYPWQYQILKLENENRKLTVYTRKREKANGAWKPDGRWTTGDEMTTSAYYEVPLGSEEIPKTQPNLSGSLTDLKQPISEQEQDALQTQLQLTMEKLKQLRQAYVIEAGIANKFQLEQQIKSEELQVSQLRATLNEIQENLKKF